MPKRRIYIRDSKGRFAHTGQKTYAKGSAGRYTTAKADYKPIQGVGGKFISRGNPYGPFAPGVKGMKQQKAWGYSYHPRPHGKTVLLYHRTSARDAAKIVKTQKIRATYSPEFGPRGAYFSDVLNGIGARYGRAAVSIKIPAKKARITREWTKFKVGGSLGSPGENEWVIPLSRGALTGVRIKRVPYKNITVMPANSKKPPYTSYLPKNSRALRRQRHELVMGRRARRAKGWKPHPTRKKAYWAS